MKPMKRLKVLPDNIHFWRGKNWPAISRIETAGGDGLRRVVAIQKLIGAHNRIAENRQLTQRQIMVQAEAIEKNVSQLVDQQLAAEKAQNAAEKWNERYIDALKHFWPKMPNLLRAEIVRQIRQANGKPKIN